MFHEQSIDHDVKKKTPKMVLFFYLIWIAFVLQDKAWQVECIFLLKAIC